MHRITDSKPRYATEARENSHQPAASPILACLPVADGPNVAIAAQAPPAWLAEDDFAFETGRIVGIRQCREALREIIARLQTGHLAREGDDSFTVYPTAQVAALIGELRALVETGEGEQSCG